MNRCHAVGIFLLVASTSVFAEPVLTISDMGLNGNSNREWLVQVAPDAALFSSTPNGTGGSLAMELAFEVTGSDLLTATSNATDWPFLTPGNNPFTGTTTLGVQVDLAGDTLFASLGSEFFTSATAVDTLTIETQGAGATTLSWGGHMLLSGGDAYIGSRISQAATNFDGYQGSMDAGDGLGPCDINGDVSCDTLDLQVLYDDIDAGTLGGPSDIDGNGVVDNDDIGAWLTEAGTTNGKVYRTGDTNLDGDVGGSDFTQLALNFGKTGLPDAYWDAGNFNGNSGGGFEVGGPDFTQLALNFGHVSVSAVPEPSSLALLISLLLGLPALTRRIRS